jgi:trimeric autotransporter adhesin
MNKFFLSLVLSTPLASLLDAQCTTVWQPGARVPGVDGKVNAMLRWDPDGPGPATPLLVLAGQFQAAGNRVASNIASFDQATGTWGTFGAGIDGFVNALAVLPGGQLVVGGVFAAAGGIPTENVAVWNGTLWLPLGTGLQGQVFTLATATNGDLYAGGNILGAGFAPVNIARWDGSNWSVVGGGTDSAVHSLAALPNGDVVAGGSFQSAGGVAVAALARWNGITWASIGAGLGPAGTSVDIVKVLANGDLVVGGGFFQAGGVTAHGLARWDGSNWTGLGTDPWTTVQAIAELPNGALVAAGQLVLPGNTGAHIARRSVAGVWTPWIDESTGWKAMLVGPAGELLVGGDFASLGGTVARSVASYDGFVWTALETGSGGFLGASVKASKVLRNGDVVVGGWFTQVDGVTANFVARWNGSSWSPLGAGVNGPVYAIEELPNGEVVVGGEFGVARWNGTAWSAIPGLDHRGRPFYFAVACLVVLPNGDLVAGGSFTGAGGLPAGNLARWNGAGWSPLTRGANGQVSSLAVLPNGDLIVGGQFTRIDGLISSGIARWDGTAWSALGTGGPTFVFALAVLPNGGFVAGGSDLFGGLVARWDGSSWTRLGAGAIGLVLSLLPLPGGDLLAGGSLNPFGSAPLRGIARWDGAAWNPVDSGCNGFVSTFAFLPDGSVLAGGDFTIVGGQVSTMLARLRSTCPANAVATGTGCIGSAGPVQLRAVSLPWLGGTFRSQATGLPANALALEIRGLATTSLPLPAVLPQGVAGCTLQVTPDLLGLVVPSQGTASSAFQIPNSLGLVGAVLHQQIAPLQFGAGGNLTAVTSSNALRLVLGVF